MKTYFTVGLSMIAGAALGAAAIQGLHAQAKPKAYQVTELEIIDNAAWQEFVKAVRASQQAASGRNLRTAMGKVVAFVGAPPKHVASSPQRTRLGGTSISFMPAASAISRPLS